MKSTISTINLKLIFSTILVEKFTHNPYDVFNEQYSYLSAIDLGLILQVITKPNTAFEKVRDNNSQYLAQGFALLVISSILSGLAILPFVMMPLDEAYLEFDEAKEFDNTSPIGDYAVALSIGSSLLTGMVSAFLYYFIGKKLDGNNDWKKVFAVVFHTNAVVIPITIIMALVLFFMWDSFTSIESSIILDPDLGDEDVFSILGPFIGYVSLLAILGICFVIWGLIITIKAIKVVHGFGTGKAFGLILLVGIITSFVSIPFGFG